MPRIAPARAEPNPAVTTLSQSFRTHRLLPEENREEYDNGPDRDRRDYASEPLAATTPPTSKKE